MAKPFDMRAMAVPILPAPTMPRVFPVTSPPMNCMGPQPGHVPERMTFSDSMSRRATANSSAQAISAVASVSTPGVFDSGIFRSVAALTSRLSNPTA